MAHDLLFTNETEWHAVDLRALFDLFSEGVLGADELKVTAGAVGLSVDVAAGSALVDSDEAGDQGKYRVVLENPLNSEGFTAGGLEAADGALPRIDRIVAHAYDDEVDGSGLTAFRLEVVTGVPTAGATLANNNGIAAMPDNALLLARVLVDAGAVAITAPKIADERTVSAPVGGGGGGGGGIDPAIIDAKGDLIVGDGPDSPTRVPVSATDEDLLFADNTTASGVNWGRPGWIGDVVQEWIDNKGDLYVGDVDNTVGVLPMTAPDGDVLTADSGAPLGVDWATPAAETLPATLFDAKGDILAGTGADAADNLAAGVDGASLIARAAANAMGLEWSERFITSLHASRPAPSAANAGVILYEYDTGCLFYSTGALWRPMAGGMVLKNADETVNNSTTLQDDDELDFPIEANETWFIQLMLAVEGTTTTPDFKMALSVPAGATRWQQAFREFVIGTGSDPGALNAGSPIVPTGNGIKGNAYGCWVFNGANAGTVKVQWAQNTATAENTTLKAGSLMLLRQLV